MKTEPYASLKPYAVFTILEPKALGQTQTIGGRGFPLSWQAVAFLDATGVISLPDDAAGSPWLVCVPAWY